MQDRVPGLRERERELAVLDELTSDAARGRGGVVVLSGPPGIGKTALVRATIDRARSSGLRVLSVRLGELDTATAFGVVRDLLAPELLRHPGQADLVGSARQRALDLLAPTPRDEHDPTDDARLRRPPRPAAPAEAGAALHALYWVVADLAQSRPLLLAVDDAQWTDAASMRFLHHLARRVEGLPAALLLATRRAGPGRVAELQRLADELAPRQVLRPAPLTREAVAARLAEHHPEREVPLDAADRLHRVTAGNPLALHQLLSALDHAGLDAADVSESQVRDIGAGAVADSVRRRLRRLPPAAIALGEALAVVGDLGDAQLLATVAGLPPQAASQALDLLVGADLVQAGPPTVFAHPLVGEAVGADVTAMRQAELARHAARLLVDAGSESAAARQLVRVEPAADEWVAAVLLRAAGDAADRGAPDVAAELLERALTEPPGAEMLGPVLAALGRAQLALGQPEAADTLERALTETTAVRARAEVAAQLAQALVDTVRIPDAARVLDRAVRELRTTDPDDSDAALGDELELQQLMFAAWEPGLHGRIAEHLATAPRPRPTSDYAHRLRLLLEATEAVSSCRPVGGCVSLLQRALADGVLFERSPSIALIAIPLLGACGETRAARHHLSEMLSRARARGRLPIVRAATGLRGQLSMWEGDVLAAEADGWGMEDVFEEGEVGAPYLLSFLTDALLAQGRVDDAVSALQRSGLWSSPLPDLSPLNAILWARGRVRVARGEKHAGLEDLLLCGRRQDGVGQRNSALVPWRAAAVAALTALGRHDDAVELATEDVVLARAFGAPHTVGAALRSLATAGPGAGDLDLLTQAHEALQRGPTRLELAAVRCDLGAALAARGERAAARREFAASAALAEQLHATVIADAAVAGLVAAGGRPRRASSRGAAALTPAERHVAEAAAAGASNREIAEALFVTEKTVETHLSSCYRKLGVRSRAQLASALS